MEMIAEQFLDTLVHDTLRQHLEFEQFTNEFDQTQTLSLGFLRNVVFFGVQGNFTAAVPLVGILDRGSFFGNPSAFKVLLTSVEQVLAE